MDKTEFSAAEARKNFAEIMNFVHHTGQEVTITKYGKAVAKIVPINGDSFSKIARATGIER